MKRLYSVTVHGNARTWSCLVWMKPRHAADWREDGIEVDEVIAIIPEAIQHMGLTRPWCWLQRVGLIPLE